MYNCITDKTCCYLGDKCSFYMTSQKVQQVQTLSVLLLKSSDEVCVCLCVRGLLYMKIIVIKIFMSIGSSTARFLSGQPCVRAESGFVVVQRPKWRRKEHRCLLLYSSQVATLQKPQTQNKWVPQGDKLNRKNLSHCNIVKTATLLLECSLRASFRSARTLPFWERIRPLCRSRGSARKPTVKCLFHRCWTGIFAIVSIWK